MTVENTTLATKVGLLISYYITLSFWSAQTLALSMVSRNIAGQTKKATVVAATFISWAAGNAIGESTYLSSHQSTKLTLCRPTGIPRLERTAVPHCVECAPRLLRLHDRSGDLPSILSETAEQEER